MTEQLTLVVLAIAVPLAAFGCDNNPGEGKPKAEVAAPAPEAPEEPAEAPKAGGGKAYAFDQEGSKLAFVGAKVTDKHDGNFEKFSGTITVVDADPTKSQVSVEIDNGSIKADVEKLTAHLKSGDFLDVEKIPTSTFKSTEIKAGGADGATHTVTGNLTLHGVTKAITFPAKISVSDAKVEVDAEFVINRKDFGIVYPGMPDDLIKDDVLIKLDIDATPAG